MVECEMLQDSPHGAVDGNFQRSPQCERFHSIMRSVKRQSCSILCYDVAGYFINNKSRIGRTEQWLINF